MVVFGIIITTSFLCIVNNSKLESEGENNANPDLIKVFGLGSLLPILFLGTLFHNSIPTTTQFVKDKVTNLPKILDLSSITIYFLFSLLGVVTSFGIEDIETQISLN